MNIQSILQNILTNPILIILIIGGFSTLGRAIKSAQEQKAKKQANQELRQAKRDSLRTGKGATAQIQSAQPTSSKAGTKTAAWDQKQQLRRDRIEQLRQQRVEQLKKIRQRRSGGQPSPTTQSQIATPRQQARPQAKPQPTAQSRSTPTRQTTQAPQRPSQPAARVIQQPAPRRRSRPPVIAPQPAKQPRRSSQTPRTIDRTAIELGTTAASQSKPTGTSIRAKFREDMRSAIIAKEILGPPIGLRSPDASPMGTL